MDAGSALGPWKDVAIAEHRALYEFVLGIVRDRAVAEDITSQAMLNGMQAWATFEPRAGATVRAWLRVIARNLAMTFFKRQKKELARSEPLDDRDDHAEDFESPNPEAAIMEVQLQTLCDRVTLELPDPVQGFLKTWARQRYADEFGNRISAEEAARSLGLTFGQYEAEKKRVRSAVLEVLRRLQPEEPANAPPHAT